MISLLWLCNGIWDEVLWYLQHYSFCLVLLLLFKCFGLQYKTWNCFSNVFWRKALAFWWVLCGAHRSLPHYWSFECLESRGCSGSSGMELWCVFSEAFSILLLPSVIQFTALRLRSHLVAESSQTDSPFPPCCLTFLPLLQKLPFLYVVTYLTEWLSAIKLCFTLFNSYEPLQGCSPSISHSADFLINVSDTYFHYCLSSPNPELAYLLLASIFQILPLMSFIIFIK